MEKRRSLGQVQSGRTVLLAGPHLKGEEERGGGGGDKRRESKHPGTKTHDLFVLQMIKNTESNVLIFFSSELVP